MENPLLTNEEATGKLDEISRQIAEIFSLDVGVFLGVNQAENNYRFANALNFLVKKRVENNNTNKFFLLCIDPDFTQDNIQITINTITTLFNRSPRNIRLVESEQIAWGDSTMFSTNTRSRVRNNAPRYPAAGEGEPASTASSIYFLSEEGEIPISQINENRRGGASRDSSLYKLVLEVNGTNGSKRKVTYLAYFMRYALRSNYSTSIGYREDDLLKIQLKRKTFQTYAETCGFIEREDTIARFYQSLYRLTALENVEKVYFFSVVHSYIPPSGPETYKGQFWLYARQSDGRLIPAGYADNRFLQDLCELHSLMKMLVDEGNDVFFINIQGIATFQPRYNSPVYHEEYSDVQLSSASELFNNSTQRKRFYRVSSQYPPYVPYSEYSPYVPYSGGKRKTRKQRAKRRKTRRV